MTEARLAELRAMFDDMAEMAGSMELGARNYSAMEANFLIVSVATLSSALVEVMDVLRSDRANLELLEAHSENLIERVYALEGGDPDTEPTHHHQHPGRFR